MTGLLCCPAYQGIETPTHPSDAQHCEFPYVFFVAPLIRGLKPSFSRLCSIRNIFSVFFVAPLIRGLKRDVNDLDVATIATTSSLLPRLSGD